MNVIVVTSDDYNFHGLIGIAKNYKSAINCLLNWTGNELRCYNNLDDGSYFYLNEEDIKKIYNLDIDEFNEIFEGVYHLAIEPLW